jgi:hypothetical protein
VPSCKRTVRYDNVRVCRKCHKISSREVCETCRRQARLYLDSQRSNLKHDGERPAWLKDMERRLFKS